jgi:hypothetical protein
LFFAFFAVAVVAAPSHAQPVGADRGPDVQSLAPGGDALDRRGETLDVVMRMHRRSSQPLADDSVSPGLRFQLGIAYSLAMHALRTQAGCRGLFETLGRNGEAVLAGSRYLEAGNSTTCLEGVAAFTTVGATKIKLCHNFGLLQPSTAAVLLLHEALHSSGLRERPGYPGAPSAPEISAVVRGACRLQ